MFLGETIQLAVADIKKILQDFKIALSNRTSYGDRNVLYLHCPIWYTVALLSLCNMDSVTEEMNF